MKSVQAGPEGDSLGEHEALVHLQQHAEDKAIPKGVMITLLKNLETWKAHQSDRSTERWEESADLNVRPHQIQDEQDEADPDPVEPVQKKRRGGNAMAGTEAPGSHPRERKSGRHSLQAFTSAEQERSGQECSTVWALATHSQTLITWSTPTCESRCPAEQSTT